MGGRNRDREDSLNPSSLCGSLVFPDECVQNIRRAGREKESHKVTKKGEKKTRLLRLLGARQSGVTLIDV